MKIIILGSNGQLGQSLQYVCNSFPGNEVIFLEKKAADILDRESLDVIFSIHNPDVAINCAAYTAVDKAEDERTVCSNINVTGAANIATVCAKYDVILIHVSTDFVFAGDTPFLLSENDKTAPINFYGLSKLNGERQIQKLWHKHIIVRTSWLYSQFGNNFVKTMLKLSSQRKELDVIIDQVGTPTYAVDMAKALFSIALTEHKAYGTFHYSNEGVISWYDFAKAIFDLTEANIKIHPIESAQYITRANRPHFSVLDKTKIKKIYNLNIPYWRDSLDLCLKEIKAEEPLV